MNPNTRTPTSLPRRVTVVLVSSTVALTGFAATADAACKNVQHRARVESAIAKTDLAYLYLRFRVCYNGKRITKIDRKEVEPAFTASAFNFSFEGVQSTVARYEGWKGSKRGSYYIKVTGSFEQGIGPAHQEHIRWVSIKAFGNGHIDRDRSN